MIDKNETELGVWDPSKDLEKQFRAFHAPKAKFESIIEDVAGLFFRVVRLFLAAKDREVILCKEKIKSIKDENDLELLRDTAAEQDKILDRALVEEFQTRDHAIPDFDLSGKTKLNGGDTNASDMESERLSYKNFTATDDVVSRQRQSLRQE
ncbi:hypothetical protein OCU04_001120 [Sclerotinia nivalis]|uniref:Uncharacterized protein n=1 Tax=Sclerotinia nivalis TaxID=352851 RepID=A0A9X0AXH2_9HELO|nr:hypothetical protein OCU04_001120 [Sclerotinia nivalis]